MHGAAAGDQDAVNGDNLKIPIGIEIDPRLLKDNTVTILVQRRDDPEQKESRPIDSTGLFCKPPEGHDDNERAARASSADSRPRVYELDGLNNNNNYNNNNNNMLVPAPTPPPRWSTMRNADDERSWGRPVAEQEPEMALCLANFMRMDWVDGYDGNPE